MKEQQPDYSKLHLLTPNSWVRAFLNHLVGTSSEDDHNTWPFTEVFARPTLDKKGVSMLPKFQGKRESLRALWCWVRVTSACARSARQCTQNCPYTGWGRSSGLPQGSTHYSAPAVRLKTQKYRVAFISASDSLCWRKHKPKSLSTLLGNLT